MLIAGMVRRYQAGALAYATGAGEVVVSGPNEQQWKLPVTLDEVGGFHLRFDQKTEATGDYAIQYQPEGGRGLRRHHGQEGGLPAADLRGAAERPGQRRRSTRRSRSICWRASSPAGCCRSGRSPGG